MKSLTEWEHDLTTWSDAELRAALPALLDELRRAEALQKILDRLWQKEARLDALIGQLYRVVHGLQE